MRYTEALDKKNEIMERLEGYIQELEKSREKLRSKIFSSHIEIHNISSEQSEIKYKASGIDSARGIKRYIVSNFYAYVGISFRENIDNYVQEADFDIVSFVQEEVELADRILEGLSMGSEILLADREVKSLDFVFMDGSVSTFIIKINSAITAAAKSDGTLSGKLKRFYEPIIDAFIRILNSGKVVFVPKSTQKEDLKSLILHILSPNENTKNIISSISDVKLAQIILNPLEYIQVNPSAHPYNLHNPYEKETDEYEEFAEKVEKLFGIANNPEVFYFKGVGGYAFRLESFAKNLPMDLIAQYTFGKTFYLTSEADRLAKDYVKTLLSESFPIEEEIR